MPLVQDRSLDMLASSPARYHSPLVLGLRTKDQYIQIIDIPSTDLNYYMMVAIFNQHLHIRVLFH